MAFGVAAGGMAAGMSQVGGLLDWLKNPIKELITNFGELIDIITNLGNLIVTALSFMVSALLYMVQIGFFWLIDFVQTVFRRVAGLETYWFRSGTSVDEHSGDIVESLLVSDTVWTVFISVMIAAIILLFVSTIIAILKTELNEKDNAKGPVIKQALKAVAYFIIVPVVCVLGVTLANIFLRTFDAATASAPVSISGQIFSASSYNANRVRNGQYLIGDYTDESSGGWGEWAMTKQRLSYITITQTNYVYETKYKKDENGNYVDYDGNIVPESQKVPELDINGNVVKVVKTDENGNKITETKQVTPITKSSSQAEIANFIDECFLRGASFGTSPGSNVSGITITDPSLYEYDYGSYMGGYAFYYHNSKTEHLNSLDKGMTQTVYIYYDLLQYNWLIGYLGSFTIIMLLLNLMIGVVQRMFDLTVLFIVSPAFIALMPLDNGQRYGKWRDEFVKRTIGCYGPIVGINLAFTVLTLAQRIIIFGPGEPMAGLFNAIMQCIFVITAILCVKDFGKLINSIVGGQDISDNKAGQVRDLMMRGAAAGATGLAMGANFANDTRKLAGKKDKEKNAQKDLRDYNNETLSERQNNYLSNTARDQARAEQRERLLHTARFKNMSEEEQNRVLDTYMTSAAGNRAQARIRNQLQASSTFNDDFQRYDQARKTKLEDKLAVAQVDVQSAKGSRYGHFMSGKERLEKAGNRSAYMKAWDDAGGKDSVSDIRGDINDLTNDVGIVPGYNRRDGWHRVKFRTAAGVASDLDRYNKQGKTNKERESAAKGDTYVAKAGKNKIP